MAPDAILIGDHESIQVGIGEQGLGSIGTL